MPLGKGVGVHDDGADGFADILALAEGVGPTGGAAGDALQQTHLIRLGYAGKAAALKQGDIVGTGDHHGVEAALLHTIGGQVVDQTAKGVAAAQLFIHGKAFQKPAVAGAAGYDLVLVIDQGGGIGQIILRVQVVSLQKGKQLRLLRGDGQQDVPALQFHIHFDIPPAIDKT